MELFLATILSMSCVSIVTMFVKANWPITEKLMTRISFVSFILSFFCIVLWIYDLRIRGAYTTSIIGWAFLISTMILFGVTSKNWVRILSGIITIPLFILSALSLFNKGFLALWLILYIPFQTPMGKFKIDENHNVEVRIGGFLACGESLTITEKSNWILDKQIYIGNNSCVHGINEIKTIRFDKDSVEFQIYHDGETEFDNPYDYKTAISKTH